MIECKLCKIERQPVIWSGEECRIVQVNDDELPGFYRVIWHDHVAEMSALDESQRTGLMRVVFGVEEVVRQIMAPAKINLASLGNQVPHLHWHIIPRFEDDPYFPDSIWSEKHRSVSLEVLEGRRSSAGRIPHLIRAQADSWVVG